MSFYSWLKRRLKRKGLSIFMPVALLAFFSPNAVSASSYVVTEESEWTFSLNEAKTVYIYGNSNRACDEAGADPYLWLYDNQPESDGSIITQDDDGNHNFNDQCVSSKIVANLDAGDYLVLAGYCCNQRGLGYQNGEYELVITDVELIGGTPTTTTTTTSSTTTTTEPQSIGPPMNLTGQLTEQGVFLDWEAPNTGNVQPERYAISFRIPPGGGWGVATGNVGDEGALVTEYTLSYDLFEGTGGLGQEYVFDVRSDNDTLGLYSGWSTQVALTVERPLASTTSTTTTTTIPATSTTTTTTIPTTTTTTTVSQTTTTTEAPPSTTTSTSTTTTTSTSTSTTTLPIVETTTTVASTVASTVVETTAPPTTTSSTLPPTTTTSTTSVPTSTTTTSSSTTTTSTSTTSTTVLPVTTTTSLPPTTTVPRTPTTAIPQNDPAVEKLPEVSIEGVLDQEDVEDLSLEELSIVLAIEDPQAAETVANLLDDEISSDEILDLVDLDLAELPPEALTEISIALTAAPTEVKEEFEEEINIFSGSFDNYVPVGSTVDVATRRVVTVATTGALILAPASAGTSRGANRGKK